MESDRVFLIRCVKERKIFWTYHCNMRLGKRALSRAAILGSLLNCEIIEEYPKDFPLPSCLCLCYNNGDNLHCVIGLDRKDDNIRIITVYRPDPLKWDEGFKKRRTHDLP